MLIKSISNQTHGHFHCLRDFCVHFLVDIVIILPTATIIIDRWHLLKRGLNADAVLALMELLADEGVADVEQDGGLAATGGGAGELLLTGCIALFIQYFTHARMRIYNLIEI